MDAVAVVVHALWVLLPAYVPNAVAVLVGGGPPIDGGRSWRGKRILGDGKTWRGAVGGALAGVVLALGMDLVRRWATLGVPALSVRVAVGLAAGAMLGDAAGSFCKRRLGTERGAKVPVLDQLGFLVGSFGLTAALAPAWTAATLTLPVLAVAVVVTPVFHRLTNVLAYRWGLKSVPW